MSTFGTSKTVPIKLEHIRFKVELDGLPNWRNLLREFACATTKMHFPSWTCGNCNRYIMLQVGNYVGRYALFPKREQSLSCLCQGFSSRDIWLRDMSAWRCHISLPTSPHLLDLFLCVPGSNVATVSSNTDTNTIQVNRCGYGINTGCEWSRSVDDRRALEVVGHPKTWPVWWNFRSKNIFEINLRHWRTSSFS